MKFLAILIVILLAFGGCTKVDVNRYANQTPALDLKQYFNGKLIGHGVVMSRGGEVKRRFVVAITGTVIADTITLDEQFTWNDGVKDSRTWTLKRLDDIQWQGSASDVVGIAAGRVAGNALNWRYVLALPVDGKTYHVNFNDWMYLIDDKVMINKAVISKFGFRLGEVLISFTKQ